MCGIAGIAALDPRRPVDAAPLAAMLSCLRHRGPDDEGVYVGDGVALGHRRLSVIDVAGGRQPLEGRDARTVVVANGEIYDYRELATELRGRGHRFRTASDTEVAAHAYDAWGLDALDRVDGMFALALWDGARRRLVLARDRMGEKPLFYTVADGLLVFASELTALLAHPAVEAELDPRALSAYLALEYVPAPLAIVRGVRKLEPGHVLVLEDGRVEVRRYWSLPAPGSARATMAPSPPRRASVPADPAAAGASREREGARVLPYPRAVARLRELLDRAVASRLVSDVPLGVFLSGGLDSSTIAALAARHGALETFSIGFEEASFDESAYATEVARRLGTHHHTRVLRGDEMPVLVPGLAELLDEPLGDASIVPTALLSAFARERVTVALGGDGGDELFAGYPMHQAHRLAPATRLLGGAAAALRGAAERLPVSHRNFAFGFKVRRYLRGLDAPPPASHGLWMASFAPAEQCALLEPDVWEAAGRGESAFAALEDGWAEGAGAGRVARAARLDALTYLPNDILTKVDRASMRVALEVRAPFLARDVVEFAAVLPDAYLMRGLTGKRILRDAARGLVPESVLRRPKKGFGIPVAAWLNGPLRELARDVLGEASLREAGLFRPAEVARLLDEHRARKADHRKALWTLLVFELWRRRNLRPSRTTAPLALGTP